MSLVLLNSNGQQANHFQNHFKQPLIIEPNSQVCCIKFMYNRNSDFLVLSTNNQLRYIIGNRHQDGVRVANLNTGTYSGAELATEIARAMNEVNQMQNYNFTCTFTAEDDTTSPPTPASFTIAFASVATPAASAPVLSGSTIAPIGQGNAFTSQTIDGAFTILQPRFDENILGADPGAIDDETFNTFCTAIDEKGSLVHNGSWVVKDITFNPRAYDPDQREADEFTHVKCGLAANEQSSLDISSGDRQFDASSNAPIVVEFLNDGAAFPLVIQMAKVKARADGSFPSVGDSDFDSLQDLVVARQIPDEKLRLVYDATAMGIAGLDNNSIPNTRFLVKITLGFNNRFIVQLQVSHSRGANYRDIPDAGFGNDANGNSYVKTIADDGQGQSFSSVIFDSSDANTYDVPGDQVDNVILPIKAPYKGFTQIGREQVFFGRPLLVADEFSNGITPTYTDGGGNAATIALYGGVHGYTYEVTLNGGAKWYLRNTCDFTIPNNQPGVTRTNAHAFIASPTDTALNIPAAGTAEFNSVGGAGKGTLTIQPTGGGTAIVLTNGGDAIDYHVEGLTSERVLTGGIEAPAGQGVQEPQNPLAVQGILNPVNRPINPPVRGQVQKTKAEAIAQHGYGTSVEEVRSLVNDTRAAQVGTNLSNPVTLLLNTLNSDDVDANDGAPAFLVHGMRSGNIGAVIGSRANVVLTATSTGGNVFQSDQNVSRLANAPTLQIAIPELSGVKSHQGVSTGVATQNQSSTMKNIAVLPQAEFEQDMGVRFERDNHKLTYVAPYENWVDVGNRQELVVNQLTTEIRQLNGELADGLEDDSVLQIKFRKDPSKTQEDAMYNAFRRDRLESSSLENTGQILSGNMTSKGS